MCSVDLIYWKPTDKVKVKQDFLIWASLALYKYYVTRAQRPPPPPGSFVIFSQLFKKVIWTRPSPTFLHDVKNFGPLVNTQWTDQVHIISSPFWRWLWGDSALWLGLDWMLEFGVRLVNNYSRSYSSDSEHQKVFSFQHGVEHDQSDGWGIWGSIFVREPDCGVRAALANLRVLVRGGPLYESGNIW